LSEPGCLRRSGLQHIAENKFLCSNMNIAMDTGSGFIASKTAAIADSAKGMLPLPKSVVKKAVNAQTQVAEATDAAAQQVVARITDKVRKSSQKAIEMMRDYGRIAVSAAGKMSAKRRANMTPPNRRPPNTFTTLRCAP
jgi:hypothetical protein